MADERTNGIILRTRPLTETSLIVQWLTPDLGRLSTVAKGARRPKSSFRGKLDLFFEAEFSFQRSRRSDLHTLREVSLKSTRPALRTDLPRIEQAAYFVNLLEQTTERETPLPEFHALFEDALAFLETHPPRPQTVFAFEFRLLELLGLEPDIESSSLGEGAKAIARRLGQPGWEPLALLQLNPVQKAELDRFLQAHLLLHLDRIPASRHVALKSA
jgi:DNA repair protein RecO